MGFFLFPPRSLGRSSPNLEGRWRAAPDISLRGLKGQGHRGQKSNLCCFFLFVPLLLPGPSFFERSRSSRSKVKFMCFFSVCSPTSPRSLDRSSPNLVGRLRAAPDISSRGSFFKGQGHRGQRSNFCISAVLGPICIKLGECIQVDP